VFSTVIVDTAGDGTAGTLYQNQAGTWIRVGSGSIIAGKIVAANISAGAIGATSLAANIVISNTIKSSDYTQDGSGTPTGGFKLDSTEPTYKLKVGAGQFGTAVKIGASSYSLGDTSGRTLTGIDSSGITATDVIWWRGNDNPGTNSGAPVIIDPLWTDNQTYTLGQRVIAGSNAAGTMPSYPNGRWVYECTTAGAGLTTAQRTATAWSSATTYTTGQVCTYSYHVYSSIGSGNLNNTPTLGGNAYWTDLGSSYGPIGTLRATDSYIDGSAKWKCVGWMYTSVNSNLSGCRGWVRSTAYAVGDLVISDVGATLPGYIGTNDKMYGQPFGAMQNPTAAFTNAGGTRVYRCTTAGTSLSTGYGPSGTSTGISDGTAVWDYWAENTGSEDRIQLWGNNLNSASNGVEYEVRIQPKTNYDNLDALTHLDVEVLGNDNTWKGRGVTLHPPVSVTIPSRKYYSPSTPAHIGNMVRTTFSIQSQYGSEVQYYIGAAPYGAQARLRVRLNNVYGYSAAIDYANWANQNVVPTPYSCALTAPPPSGSGGGSGSIPCPEPWVEILTTRGLIPAGDIKVGDIVITKHETTGVDGEWAVISTETDTNETAMLTVSKMASDGTKSEVSIAFALNHRFVRNGGWTELRDIQVGSTLESTDGSDITVVAIEPRGINSVVKITVEDAHTYSTSGILSHNIKILD
jgi:hypothetical protein